jgi:small subunit ribosomal protein S20
MPNTSSAKKSLHQSKTRRARNRVQRSTLRTVLKKCRTAAGTPDADAAFRLAVKKLDQAAAKRLIHPNTAARTKSRLSQVMKSAKAAPAVASE